MALAQDDPVGQAAGKSGQHPVSPAPNVAGSRNHVRAQARERLDRPAPYLTRAINHNYSRYSMGCRCDTCRIANRDYQREARARQRRAGAARRLDSWLGLKPGTVPVPTPVTLPAPWPFADFYAALSPGGGR
jgi:hypothetical protein